MRRVPSRHRNAPVARERDRGALKRFSFLLICGLLLAGGFVYAGGQHFAALKLGYQTEKLRNSLTEARQLGMQPMQPAQIDPLRQRTAPRELKVPGETKIPAKTAAKLKTQQPRGK